ncbi:MAG: hypothetical protein ACJAVX_003176 [Pseudoalteromonas rhizosphaerae]|jgi:hypothetical protein
MINISHSSLPVDEVNEDKTQISELLFCKEDLCQSE